MFPKLCAKIGGIWCYWPENNELFLGVIIGIIVIILLVIWFLVKKFK